MKSFISKWFTRFVTEKSKYLPLSEQNKILLINELEQCYTVNDIKLLREVLRLCAEDFTFDEHLDFELKISYRMQLIKYCNANFGNEIFTIHQIRSLFRNATSISVCNAIMLHVQMNKEWYNHKYSNYSLFEIMNTNSKYDLLTNSNKIYA